MVDTVRNIKEKCVFLFLCFSSFQGQKCAKGFLDDVGIDGAVGHVADAVNEAPARSAYDSEFADNVTVGCLLFHQILFRRSFRLHPAVI